MISVFRSYGIPNVRFDYLVGKSSSIFVYCDLIKSQTPLTYIIKFTMLRNVRTAIWPNVFNQRNNIAKFNMSSSEILVNQLLMWKEITNSLEIVITNSIATAIKCRNNYINLNINDFQLICIMIKIATERSSLYCWEEIMGEHTQAIDIYRRR